MIFETISEETNVILCDICFQEDNTQVPATCYCEDCEENLCKECDLIHRNKKYQRHKRNFLDNNDELSIHDQKMNFQKLNNLEKILRNYEDLKLEYTNLDIKHPLVDLYSQFIKKLNIKVSSEEDLLNQVCKKFGWAKKQLQKILMIWKIIGCVLGQFLPIPIGNENENENQNQNQNQNENEDEKEQEQNNEFENTTDFFLVNNNQENQKNDECRCECDNPGRSQLKTMVKQIFLVFNSIYNVFLLMNEFNQFKYTISKVKSEIQKIERNSLDIHNKIKRIQRHQLDLINKIYRLYNYDRLNDKVIKVQLKKIDLRIEVITDELYKARKKLDECYQIMDRILVELDQKMKENEFKL
ncbi:zinc finger protein constans-like [Anaeramoeba flamelloides]|uniref:Zinc finger protein constans-like n=1 Tax=Anaeramoeba flamelloides TaxID=1746091 RepID=A0AAV7ZMF0_9EUKA|nr:zinc finger protein constans-like [Anaeramoeba flamelloides]